MQMLSAEAVTAYRRDGFLFPLPGIGASAAREYRAALEAFESRAGDSISILDERFKPHVRFPWADRLVREPAILDVVEQVIGPDILVWMGTFFVKESHADAVTLWHQDWTFFGLRPHEHVTAWVALSEASVEAGCMRFIPGKSAARPMRHRPRVDPNSINGGGQCVIEPFDDADAKYAALVTGDFSLHNTLCIHSSSANDSGDRRIGLGISYVPAHVRHIGTYPVSAMLVRGEDRYGNFVLERPPTGDDAADAAYHAEIYRTYR
ncbi:MAG: phytanoyl-CoA dioxygenase family protein, partial [Hyphomicrobiaceae bacterium]